MDPRATAASSFGAGASESVPAATVADGWEAVPPPSSPAGAAEERGGRGWEMVAPSASFGDCAVFPPSLHEGLHVDPHQTPTLTQEPVGVSGELCSPPVDEPGEDKTPLVQKSLSDSARGLSDSARGLSDSARRLLGLGLDVIYSKFHLWRRGEGIWSIKGGGGGCCYSIKGGVWSLAAVAGVLGALMYLRRRSPREMELLLLLMKEKDQRINDLLQQIALMNEFLAAHRQVSVVRRP